jgi:hypothetical protein
VVSRRGRCLYPTPDILANYLTRDTIKNLGIGILRQIFDVLSEGAQRSLAERLRQLGDDPLTRDSVATMLGDLDFFAIRAT